MQDFIWLVKKQPGYASMFWNTIQVFIWGSKSGQDMLRCFENRTGFYPRFKKWPGYSSMFWNTIQVFTQVFKSGQNMLRSFEIPSRILSVTQKATRICFDVLKYYSGFYLRLKKPPQYASMFSNTVQVFTRDSKSSQNMLRHFEIVFILLLMLKM